MKTLLFLLLAFSAHAELLTLACDPLASTDATKILWKERTAAGDVVVATTASTVTTATFNAVPGVHTYFATCAADDGRESPPGNLLTVTIALPPLVAPTGLKRVVPQQIQK